MESRPAVDGPYDDPMFLEDMEASTTRIAPELLEKLIERKNEVPGLRCVTCGAWTEYLDTALKHKQDNPDHELRLARVLKANQDDLPIFLEAHGE